MKFWIPIGKPLLKRLLILGALVAVITVALVILAVFYGWSHFAQSLAPLDPWHKEYPQAEFTASDETAGYDFDDYLKQEGDVFDELNAFIEGPWKPAATGTYCRFNPASVSYPTALFDRNWNRTFLKEAENPIGGALLIHGLSDSPYSMRATGERLSAAGYTVLLLRVPGHGTCPAALAKVDAGDWRAAVRVAARGLREKLPPDAPLVVMGFSNGGALSVNYAIEALNDESLPNVSALVLMSPMIGITPLAKITRYHHWIAAASGDARANWSAVQAAIDPYKYASWPMNASVQAWRMTQRVEEGLAQLEKAGRMGEFPPVLTCQSAIDATVKVALLMSSLYGRVVDNGSELMVFDVNRVGWMESLINLDFEKALEPAFRSHDLTYDLTVVTNASPDSEQAIAKTRDGEDVRKVSLNLSWPDNIYSLAHAAVPFEENDPIYGAAGKGVDTRLPLGSMDFKGEAGVLRISSSQIVRLRHNPFFPYMAERQVEWLSATLGGKVD